MNTYTRYRSVLLMGAALASSVPLAAHAQQDPGVPLTTTGTEQDEDIAVQDEIVVRGQFIPDEVRSTSEVAALINEEDFVLQGDADAASALARVAGIATADDRFIYVRGLNERYSTALLNGSPLPSPEPLRRVAPLDLFPTAALDSVLVQKTYSPNLPGEFGGGLVGLRTKTLPDERFLTIGGSLGYDTESSLQDGLLYDGSDTDFLGYDDGLRDLPDLALLGTGEFGRQLTDDSSLLVMQRGETGPNIGLGFSFGERLDVNEDLSVGFLGSANYGNSWSTREGRRGFAFSQGDGLGVFRDQARLSTQNTVDANGLATLGFEIFDNHELQFVGLITRSTDKEARTIQGENEEDVNVREDFLEFFERQLFTGQVLGEHVFPQLMDLEVAWRASYSEAFRDAPYEVRNIYLIDDDGSIRLASSPTANRFVFSRIDDDTTDLGVDLSLPILLDGDYFSEIELRGGYAYVENDRFATQRIIDVDGVTSLNNQQRLDFIYASIFNNGSGQASILGGEAFPPVYVSTLEIDAFYGQAEVQITPFIRASLGLRYEDAIQAVDVQSFDQDPDTNFVEGVIDRDDIMPAVSITWNPLDDLQVRAAYSETITRPQFRELASAVFTDTETDVNFFGNPFLQNSDLKNYDVRGEYYFARGQFFRVGFFYKEIENPIEEILVPAETLQTTFINAPAADLYGVEVEYEQALPLQEWFDSFAFLGDSEITVKTNYTYSDSEVDANGEIPFNIGTNLRPVFGLVDASGRIEDGRRLQGQSEHLFNLQLIYSDEAERLEANLLFNYTSERIRTAELAQRNLPAIVEEVPNTVDFVLNKGFDLYGGGYEVSFNIENIFGDGYEAYQERGGDRVAVDTFDLGTVFTIGLKRSFYFD